MTFSIDILTHASLLPVTVGRNVPPRQRVMRIPPPTRPEPVTEETSDARIRIRRPR